MPLRPDHGSNAAEIQSKREQAASDDQSSADRPLSAIGPSPEFAPIAAPSLPIPPVRPDPEPDYRVESDTDFGVPEYGRVRIELPMLDEQAVEPADPAPATDDWATDQQATEPWTDERATTEPWTDGHWTDEGWTTEPRTDEPWPDEPRTDGSWTDESWATEFAEHNANGPALAGPEPAVEPVLDPSHTDPVHIEAFAPAAPAPVPPAVVPVPTLTAPPRVAVEQPTGRHAIIPAVRRRGPELWARLGAALVILGLTIYRMVVAADATYPGHADPAFYYEVGRRLATGHGPTVNYIWHYLAPVNGIPHFAWDYWLPMPSLLISVGQHFQSGMSSALDVGIALTAVFAAGTYQLAWRLTRSWWIPAIASIMVSILPSVSIYSMRTESAVYLASFTVLALSAVVGARERVWRWSLAGALTGIAGLARNEGLLLIGVMAVAAIAWNTGWRKLTRLGLLLAGYLAIMGPYMIVSWLNIHALVPPASQKFPYISSYNQLYSLHVKQSWSVLFSDAMWDARGQAFTDQWQLGAAIYRLGVLIALLALIGVSLFLRRPSDVPRSYGGTFIGRAFRSAWMVPVFFAVLVPVFESTVTPVVAGAGSVQKSGITLAPVLVIAALQRARRLPGLRPDNPRWMRSWTWALQILAFGAACTLMVFPAMQLPKLTTHTVQSDNGLGATSHHLLPALRLAQKQLGPRQKLVLMTANPWDVSQATGYPTVMVPQGSVCQIVNTALKYGATDIETREGNRPQPHIEWLAHHGGPFTPVIGNATYRIYQIDNWAPAWCEYGFHPRRGRHGSVAR